MRAAEQDRVSRSGRDAAEMAEAAQAAAESARFERLEQRVRRTINGLFWVMGALWMAGLGAITAAHWLGWPR